MTPGLFDLPAPLLEWLDVRIAEVLPPFLAIALWGVVGGILCIELYRMVSPQRRIREIKRDAREAQNRLSGFDGELDEAWPMIRSMLGLSLKRVGIVIPATLIAAYPVIALLVWISSAYGHVLPEDNVGVTTRPPMEAHWVPGGSGPPLVRAMRQDGALLLETPLEAAIPVLHKRLWWNVLIANPAGYLPDDAAVEEVRLALPRRELHAVGPTWLRGWEAAFLPALFIAALAYKIARGID